MLDATPWVDRWDRQQERYVPHREERFSLMLDVVELRRGSGSLRVVDLCCGVGSISARTLARFPYATLVAVDFDPVLLEVGRHALGDRVVFLDADVRKEGWAGGLEPGSFDAVLSATAIHWLPEDAITRLYATLAAMLCSGGVFLNADHLPVATTSVAESAARLLEAWQQRELAGGEDFGDYLRALAAEPELAKQAAERERRFAVRDDGSERPLAWHRDQLLTAGFSEVDEVWRHLGDAVLLGIR
jgi:trans-aconitate methyltransferase